MNIHIHIHQYYVPMKHAFSLNEVDKSEYPHVKK